MGTCRIKITPGMANKFCACSKIKLRCECGLNVPVYRGRYPTKCPSCGGKLYTVDESTRLEYYQNLEEYFALHKFMSEISETPNRIKSDIVHMWCAPILLECGIKDLLEVSNSVLRLSNRSCTATAMGILSEAFQTKDLETWIRGIQLYPDYILSESPKHSDVWLLCRNSLPWMNQEINLHGRVFSPSRALQILSEAYLFAMKNGLREDSKTYASLMLSCENSLLEGIWKNDIPGNLNWNSKEKEASWVSGGFRFRLKDKNATLGRIRDFQKKILSRRNRTMGIASKITSARQLLQRSSALRKAQQWHKASPFSGMMHRGLGRLMHRSNGLYQNTSEGLKNLKHLNESENSLRIFSSGKEYFQGNCFSFAMDIEKLYESQIRDGSSYVLKSDLLLALYRKTELGGRILVGSEVKVLSSVDAAKWQGDYPNPPMGQRIYSLEVISGERKGEIHEVDGVDFSESIGLNEGVCFSSKSVLSDSLCGGIFASPDRGEVVISSFDSLITERIIGALFRGLKQSCGFIPKKDCVIRCYNDMTDFVQLQESLSLSQKSHGKSLLAEFPCGLLFEDKERAIVMARYKNEILMLKSEWNKMKTEFQNNIASTREEMELEEQKFKERLAEIEARKTKALNSMQASVQAESVELNEIFGWSQKEKDEKESARKKFEEEVASVKKYVDSHWPKFKGVAKENHISRAKKLIDDANRELNNIEKKYKSYGWKIREMHYVI